MHARTAPSVELRSDCSCCPGAPQQKAEAAYSRREFKKAVDLFSELIYQQPNDSKWSERRGEVLIASRNFGAAIMDYNEAMQQTDSAHSLSCCSTAPSSCPFGARA